MTSSPISHLTFPPLSSLSPLDKLYMSVVSSGLSESDRSHLIDLSITKLENEAMIIQLSTSQESAHDILVEAAEDAYEVIFLSCIIFDHLNIGSKLTKNHSLIFLSLH